MTPSGRQFLFLAMLSAAAPEPSGYWTGPNQGEVPATVSGGSVIHTPALTALLQRGKTVLIDVSPLPPPPPDLPKGTLWMPPPHRDIPGSVWLPDAGHGDLAAADEAFYRARLDGLTNGDRDRPLVLYCHPKCWLSWNAAKRAVAYGYRQVYWYPDGIEGWNEAGNSTVAVPPERPRSEPADNR